MRKKTTNRCWCNFLCNYSVIRKRWRRYWSLMVKRKYRIKKRTKRKYKKKGAEILEKNLDFYILQANSGVNQCKETNKIMQ